MPLTLLVKGKTTKCTDRFRESPVLRRFFASHQLRIQFSASGWSDHKSMLDYLAWLHDYNKERPCHVIFDVHASHLHDDVLKWAQGHEMGVTFIPPGQTGTWQPLDRRIFGSLKARATKLMNQRMATESFEEHNIMKAIAFMVEAWNQISPEEIRNAWAHFDA